MIVFCFGNSLGLDFCFGIGLGIDLDFYTVVCLFVVDLDGYFVVVGFDRHVVVVAVVGSDFGLDFGLLK